MAELQTLKDDTKTHKYVNHGREKDIYSQASERNMIVWFSDSSWPMWEVVFHSVQDSFDEEFHTRSRHVEHILVNFALKPSIESTMFFKQRRDCYYRKILSMQNSFFLTLAILTTLIKSSIKNDSIECYNKNNNQFANLVISISWARFPSNLSFRIIIFHSHYSISPIVLRFDWMWLHRFRAF